MNDSELDQYTLSDAQSWSVGNFGSARAEVRQTQYISLDMSKEYCKKCSLLKATESAR